MPNSIASNPNRFNCAGGGAGARMVMIKADKRSVNLWALFAKDEIEDFGVVRNDRVKIKSQE